MMLEDVGQMFITQFFLGNDHNGIEFLHFLVSILSLTQGHKKFRDLTKRLFVRSLTGHTPWRSDCVGMGVARFVGEVCDGESMRPDLGIVLVTLHYMPSSLMSKVCFGRMRVFFGMWILVYLS